jgi:hypothetical protein
VNHQTNDDSSQRKPSLVRNIVLGIGGIFVAISLLLWFFIWPQSVQSQGNKHETGITAAYEDGANYLSACINKSQQAADLANANTAALDKIVSDAVAGTGNAGHFNLSTPGGRSGLYAMFVQAYPNVDGLNKTFNNVLIVITGCQDDFRNKQSLVIDRVRAFTAWRAGSWITRTFGGNNFPNDNLRIPLPGTQTVLTGMAALDRASVPIVNTLTSNAYQRGTYNPGNPFKSSTPTPTPSTTSSK